MVEHTHRHFQYTLLPFKAVDNIILYATSSLPGPFTTENLHYKSRDTMQMMLPQNDTLHCQDK